MGRKITLAQCKSQGDIELIMYCETPVKDGRGICHHRGQTPIDPVIEKYGADVRLDDLPFRCSKCGGTVVEVRADSGPKTAGGLPLPRR